MKTMHVASDRGWRDVMLLTEIAQTLTALLKALHQLRHFCTSPTTYYR